MRHRTIVCGLSLLATCTTLAACGSGSTAPDIESTSFTTEAVLGGTKDDSSAAANVVAAIESADGTSPSCSGMLLTPTVVITARPCVDPKRVGAFPIVRVGSTFATATRYFSTRMPLVQAPGVNDGSAANVNANGQLALIYLDPRKPVLTDAVIPHQLLQPPTTAADQSNADWSWSYANIGLSGWSPTTAILADGGRTTASTVVREKTLFASANLFSNTDFTVDSNHPFFVRDSTATAGKLTDVDLGGPIYVQDATTGQRQIIGVAVQIAVTPSQVSSGACPTTAKSCDVWADVTADPNASWIVENLQVQAQSSGPHKNMGWLATHTRDVTRADGTPDWWQGEVDYTGPCQSTLDADCDHWFDRNGTSTPVDAGPLGAAGIRDNCIGWFNPEQADFDDDAMGDSCDNCAAFSNPLQTNTSAAWVNKSGGTIVPPASRVAELRETLAATYPGDGCRLWNGYAPSQNSFNSLWVNTEEDAWAVGSWGAMLHWDGQAWNAVPSPSGGQIWAVWGAGTNDVWAVGDGGSAIHWDGSSWSATTTPAKFALRAVWGSSPSNVWAVGDVNTRAGYQADGTWKPGTNANTILHWNGTAWTSVTTGLLNGGDAFTSLWGSGPNDVWAGGWEVLAHWNGSTWSYSRHDMNTAVNGLWGSGASDVWGVGWNPSKSTSEILHWNGSSWSETDGTLKGEFTGISGRSSTDVYASASNGLVWAWNGTAWSSVSTDNTSPIRAIAARPDGLWLAGDSPTIWRRRDLQWGGTVTGTVAVTATAVASASNAFGFPANGSVWDLTNSNPAFRNLPEGSTSTIRATWSDQQGHVWAVGDNGAAITWGGSSWSSVSTGTMQALAGVSGTSTSDVWAVGAAGTIVHFDGATWKTSTSTSTSKLSAVFALAPNDAWAAGDAETVLHWNGTAWWPVPTPASGSTYRALWGAATNDVWMAGTGGQMMHWDGAGWSLQQSAAVGIASNFVSMIGASSSDIWATTDQRVMHYDGNSWSQFGVSAGDALSGVSYAAGAGTWLSSARGYLGNLVTSDPICSVVVTQSGTGSACHEVALIGCNATTGKLSYQRIGTNGVPYEMTQIAESSPASASSYTDSSTGTNSYRVCNIDDPAHPKCTPTMVAQVPASCPTTTSSPKPPVYHPPVSPPSCTNRCI